MTYLEMVKAAANVKGVDINNIVEISEKIAKFIIGDAELPDVYDPTAAIREAFEKGVASTPKPDTEKMFKELKEKLEQQKKEHSEDGIGK